MGLFDFGNMAKKLQEAGEGLSKTVSSAAEKLPEIKPEELANAMKNAVQSGQNALNAAISSAKDGVEKKEADSGNEPEELSEVVKDVALPAPEKSLSTEEMLKIIYCLMSVDGEISTEEEQKFNQIGTEMDAEFTEHKEAYVEECRKLLDDVDDSEERYEVIHDFVSDLIRASKDSSSVAPVGGKLILWDLYAIVYSDNEFTDAEQKLLRYICRALQIDKSVASEMEQTFKTLMAIDNEEKWLKTTNRRYDKIEERLNELADRKQTIMQSIYALISD